MQDETLRERTTTQSEDEERALFKVLKRRRACRNFEPKQIPDEILQKLAYAAHRAPTGGNAPYRFVVVVKDPLQLKMIKLVSPGYFGDTSAAIFVCIDTRAAYKGKGGAAELLCASHDAGAAAENIVLAAYSMGLGASFVKSYSELAVAKILDLPEGCRTELLVSVGYPAKDEPKPLKKRKGSTMTFLDRFGHIWSGDKETGSNINSPALTIEAR
jgi:nitroreductase